MKQVSSHTTIPHKIGAQGSPHMIFQIETTILEEKMMRNTMVVIPGADGQRKYAKP